MTDERARIRGMQMTDEGAALVIVRRWLRTRHFVMLGVVFMLDAVLVHLWRTQGFTPWLLLGSILVTSWNVTILSMFVTPPPFG